MKKIQREERERQVEMRLRRAEEKSQREEERAQRAEERAQRAEEKVHQLEQRAQQAEAKGNKLLMRWDGERREHERLAVQLGGKGEGPSVLWWANVMPHTCTYVWIQRAALRLMGA